MTEPNTAPSTSGEPDESRMSPAAERLLRQGLANAGIGADLCRLLDQLNPLDAALVSAINDFVASLVGLPTVIMRPMMPLSPTVH